MGTMSSSTSSTSSLQTPLDPLPAPSQSTHTHNSDSHEVSLFSQEQIQCSTNLLGESHIDFLSKCICTILYGTLKRVEKRIQDQISNFFKTTRRDGDMTVGEAIHGLWLFHHIIAISKKLVKRGEVGIISESTFGTFLLCTSLIAMKMERDRPLPNSWWSRTFGVPLEVVNNGEMAVLSDLDFRCDIEEGNFGSMLESFDHDSTGAVEEEGKKEKETIYKKR
jgi:hypothetical protein